MILCCYDDNNAENLDDKAVLTKDYWNGIYFRDHPGLDGFNILGIHWLCFTILQPKIR